MGSIKCFLLEQTDRSRLYLRRYESADRGALCNGLHDSRVAESVGDVPTVYAYCDTHPEIDGGVKYLASIDPAPYLDRFPTHCEKCGHAFSDSSIRQVRQEPIYRNPENGEEFERGSFPPGAIYEVPWLKMANQYFGPDGKCYACMTPGGEWIIDGVASNCNRTDAPEHRCWPRRGDAPNFTIDLSLGNTCSAGAGSIQCGSYHGFLRDGHLVD